MYKTGDYIKTAVRSAAILTDSYVAGTVIGPATGDKLNVQDFNQLTVLVQWTKGSLTSLEVKVEFSHDGTTYYQEANIATSGATNTVTLGSYTTTVEGNFPIVISNLAARFVKISVKGTGTVTSSSCTVDAVLSVV